MKKLLDIINRGVFRGLNEHKIELLSDLEDDELGLLDSILVKSINDKYDATKLQLKVSIRTGKISKSLKEIINDSNNFHKYKSVIKANDRTHLLELILIGLELLDDDGNFNWIDTSEITDMSNLFYENSTFNGHIELWDVSNVTNMWRMFAGAVSFNLPIGDWDVSNVTDMSSMFEYCDSFNLPIGSWDVSNVTNMEGMFCYAKTFNLPLNNWDVSRVYSMYEMFKGANTFNLPLNNWDISRVEHINNMFYGACSFDLDLSTWDIRRFNLTWGDMFVFCDKLQSKHTPKFK